MLLIPVEPISYILPTRIMPNILFMIRGYQESYDLRVAEDLPLTHIGGAFVAFAMRNDIAISSQFLLLDASHA